MDFSEVLPLDEPAVESARSRAAHSPEHLLPCPVCAASVKGISFSQHVSSKHGFSPGQVVPTDDPGQLGAWLAGHL
jgi:DNA-binding helix-hairpin-helix protein with protein kinase domain